MDKEFDPRPRIMVGGYTRKNGSVVRPHERRKRAGERNERVGTTAIAIHTKTCERAKLAKGSLTWDEYIAKLMELEKSRAVEKREEEILRALEGELFIKEKKKPLWKRLFGRGGN